MFLDTPLEPLMLAAKPDLRYVPLKYEKSGDAARYPFTIPSRRLCVRVVVLIQGSIHARAHPKFRAKRAIKIGDITEPGAERDLQNLGAFGTEPRRRAPQPHP